MLSNSGASRERRVTLATKWANLDHLTAGEIVEKFERDHGIEITKRTVRNYLNSEEADVVEDRIREEHGNVRLQVIDREERMYQRARTAEAEAYEDVPIQRVFPQVHQRRVDRDPMRYPVWEWIQPGDDDWPEWGTPDKDTPIRFTDEYQTIEPGQRYPVKGIDGKPKYTTELVGVETVPDEKTRAFRRGEQSDHLEAKGEAANIYEDTVNFNGEIEQSMDDEQQTDLLDAIGALQED